MKPLRGYTLLELIVSVGLFSMVMLIATGAYLTLVHLDRKARASTDVMTNLNFVVESMAREIRTGKDYRCDVTGTNCSTPASRFQFTDNRSSARTIVYSLVNNQVYISINGSTAVALTDPRVYVERLDFYVRGVGTSGANQYLQPQVTFVMQGRVEAEPGNVVQFSLQGSATQRLLELI